MFNSDIPKYSRPAAPGEPNKAGHYA